MLGSAVCDLCVMGISSLRLLLDLREFVNAVVRRVTDRCFPEFAVDAQLIDPMRKLDDYVANDVAVSQSLTVLLPAIADANCSDNVGEGVDVELLGLFWDSDGNAVLRDSDLCAHSSSDILSVQVRN
ncbi:Hypothetical protein, putative [Bodo saltans]|uniref:Uncharacterized protein n=1 Tax=Bodo saltans TaxID=75058 RepID=A0A0S4J4D6_BODSA|nr:Hypothetical protein, putative [Bodo saltans]|eukprot:CUG79351.1 Hypothetical protein, putative [Bodo saltans]